MWYIVLFTQENSVSVVPACWYVENSKECFWPPVNIKGNNLEKLIKNKDLPDEDWKPFKAKLLGKFEDYKQAIVKVQRAKNKDKLSTTDDNENAGRGKRKKKPSYKFHQTSSSDADESSGSNNSLLFPSYAKDFPTYSKELKITDNYADATSNFARRSRSLSPLTESRTFFPEQARLSNQEQESLGHSFQESLGHSFQESLGHSSQSRPFFSREQTRLPNQERESLGNSSKSRPFLGEQTRLSNQEQERSFLQNTNTNNVSQRKKHLPKSSGDDYSKKNSQLRDGHQETDTLDVGGQLQILAVLQKIQADSLEFRVQVLRKLNIINIKINDMETAIQNLKMSDVQENKNEEWKDEYINSFPLDMDKLNKLENSLVNDDSMKKLMKYLSRVGGSDVPETVKRLMYKIFTNEVGTAFSWDGAKGKLKFKNLKIATVILNTVRCNNSTKDATDADIIIYIKKWLVRCKDRIKRGGEKIRRNEIQNQDEDVQEM